MSGDPIRLALELVTSDTFKRFINRLRGEKKQPEEIAQDTVDELAEQQAEGLTYEKIYVGLLENRITEADATKTIENLGEKVNPHPLAWLKKKLLDIRSWIINAIKFLRQIGDEVKMKVKQIE